MLTLIRRSYNNLKILITNPNPEHLEHFEKKYTLQVKSLEAVTREGKDGSVYYTGDRESVKHPMLTFTKTTKQDQVIYITFGGYFDEVYWFFKSCGPTHVRDLRNPLPRPEPLPESLSLRYSQPEIARKIMSSSDSGRVVLPTRYGKTYIILATLLAYKIPILFIVPGSDLIAQQVETLSRWIPRKSIGVLKGNKNKITDTITVASPDSLHKLNDDMCAQFRLVVGDEIHSLVSPTRILSLTRFPNARMVGFTATDSGRFDNTDRFIEGVFGPTIVRRTFQEAVQEGAICPITVYLLRTKLKFNGTVRNRTHAYRRYVFYNPEVREIIHRLLTDIIPPQWQTLAFVETKKQVDFLWETIDPQTVPLAMARLFTSKTEREALTERVRNGSLKRCFASGIYAQGMTFSDLRCLINICGGGGSITSVQKPGRLAEKVEGKESGYMIDFMYYTDPEDTRFSKTSTDVSKWRQVVSDSVQRKRMYEKLGYTLKYVNDINEIELT
jgi:superfamily II DNA or RNA helicase